MPREQPDPIYVRCFRCSEPSTIIHAHPLRHEVTYDISCNHCGNHWTQSLSRPPQPSQETLNHTNINIEE